MHVALDLYDKDVLSFSYGQGASSDHLAVKELISNIDTKHIKTNYVNKQTFCDKNVSLLRFILIEMWTYG